MELKVSSINSGGLSPDYVSDPEEKEVSDEDDDDRNHKHRRRETRSQSLETGTMEPTYTRPYRKRNKPFENGHPLRENESQASETWKNYNNSRLEKDFTMKVEKRRHGVASLSRGPLDLNQRIRSNQTLYGEPGPGRGRGRDSVSRNQRDSRFNSVDSAQQMVQHGSITSNLFGGRGLPTVLNSQTASWNAFGLIPGVPNSGLEALHPIGFQGTLRPAVNSSMNIGIPRPRCRDFEERGFCLRGDMCPMEHGVNRIVVEDVQSLSQFNLPVSLPSGQLLGTSVSSGALPSTSSHSATLTSNRGALSKTSKPGMNDASLGLNGTYSSSAAEGGADLYDPDEPLWNDDGPESSNALSSLQSLKNDKTEPSMSVGPSDRHHIRSNDAPDNEFHTRSAGVTVGSHSTSSSVWGRIDCSKGRLDAKEKSNLPDSTSGILEDENKEDNCGLTSVHGTPRQGKRISAADAGMRTVDSPLTQGDVTRSVRRTSQKALRTLFVNGIPHKSNRREALLSHFQKFGEVIDIYIPVNSERAFVQFSKREEAEAALRAPDAVMGNRFIKLWWANRDSIPDDGISTTGSIPVAPSMGIAASAQLHPPASKAKENIKSATPKSTTSTTSDASLPPGDHPKPGIMNGPKVPPPLQKKLELEQLKEELRKKQELLEQKRNDFRRQLDKFEKQASGIRGEVVAEPSPKRHRMGIAADDTTATPLSMDPGASVGSPLVDVNGDRIKSADNVVSSNPVTATVSQEPVGSKHPIHPIPPARVPFLMNRYKLDNRPTAFQVMPPLPSDLANVDALKEYFSSFGELSSVELEDVEPSGDDGDGSEKLKRCSAFVNFTTRHSAERAFLKGKFWQGNSMQFVWVTSRSSSNDPRGNEDSLPAPGYPVDADAQPAEKSVPMNSNEASVSKDGDTENCESNIAKNIESDVISQFKPHLSSISGQRESPEPKFCLTAMSEDKDPSSMAIAGQEKQSSEGDGC